MSELQKANLRILYLEDDLVDRDLVRQTLKADGVSAEFLFCLNEAQFRAGLKEPKFDIILSDFTLPTFDGMAALVLARKAHPEIPFIFFSGTIGDEKAVETLKSGATDYVLKGQLNRLSGAINRALREASQIRERKHAEQRLLESEEKLRQAQKMEAIGQLAGGVAHDFSNLLCVIRGNTELVLMDPEQLNAEARECLKAVAAASERAASLTQQLLAFGRKQVMQSRAVNLNEVIGNLTKMLVRVIAESIRLQRNYANRSAVVQADVGMIEQVIINLVVNARDAMPKGGDLTISTERVAFDERQAMEGSERRPGEFICLSVQDTGTGIAPEHMQRLFEPFFTTKEAGKGTGLGLATVYGIVKQHQGWVEVTSQVGTGTTFKVFLPAIGEGEKGVAAKPVETKVRGGSETILLVEDDEQVRLLSARVLENAGYQVLQATSGKAALDVWRENASKVELLLTDLIMPDGLTGHELAEQLSKNKPDLKVILASGYGREVAGKDTAFFVRRKMAFLPKPYTVRALLQTVRQSLDGEETLKT